MEQEGDKKGHEGWRWTPPRRFPNAKGAIFKIMAGQSEAADSHLRSMSADLHYARAIVMLHEPSGQNLLLESGTAHFPPPRYSRQSLGSMIDECIFWSGGRVERAGWSQHGWLRPHFEAQKRGSFCALASCAIVLNALRSASPPTSSPPQPPPTGCSQEVDPPKKKRRRTGDGDDNGSDDDDDDDHTRNCQGEEPEATRTEQRRPPPDRVVTQDDLFSEIVMKHLHKRERDMHKGEVWPGWVTFLIYLFIYLLLFTLMCRFWWCGQQASTWRRWRACSSWPGPL